MKARRRWAWPLLPLYAAGLASENILRRTGILRSGKLQSPVVSVGSLSAGGAGKTPVVIALATLLQQHGWSVDVLSRGYGRTGQGVDRVDPTIPNAAARFGDEPVLVAQRTAAPVWVAAERFAAGQAAEEAHPTQPHLHLLDDGFQHRRLARTFDIVLVTAADLRDALIPAGNRRESLYALGRADAVVIRDDERVEVEPAIRRFLRPAAAVWTLRRELHLPTPPGPAGAGTTPVAFCAIARPGGFWSMLKQAGCNPIAKVAYQDHHAYSNEDIDRLLKIAGNLNATSFVTTEKDGVKLSAAMLERLQTIGPVCIVALNAVFVEEQEVMRTLEARCR